MIVCPPSDLTQTLLRCAQEHGFLSPMAAQRVPSLVDHGLQLEQALLGTGLMSREQYRLLFQEVTGDAWEPLPRRVHHPSDNLWMAVRQARDVLRHLDRSSHGAVHTVASNVVHACAPQGSGSISLHHRVDPAMHSALALRLVRRTRPLGYLVNLFPTPHGMILRLERTPDSDHPREWMEGVRRFLDKPVGLLVIRRPDVRMEQWIRAHLPSAESAQAWREADVPLRIEGTSRHALEWIEHALLLERPTVVLEQRPEGDWEAYASQGIPVHLVESHSSPHGRAWSSYPLYVSSRSAD